MTTFNNDKEKAAENKYAHDKETEFKVHARRNKLLGLWIAEKIGLTADDALEYAKEVITVDLEHPNDEAVFHKVKTDMLAKNIEISDHDIREQMHNITMIARAQIAG